MRNRIREVLSANKRFYIIIPIVMIIIVLPFSFVISIYDTILKYSHTQYSDGYKICDAYGIEGVLEFFSDDSAMKEELNKQMSLYSGFKQVWGEDYYVITEQAVEIQKAYGEEFSYGYDFLDKGDNSEYFVNCYQMNSAAIKGSPMKLHSGRWFYENEYVACDNIPIIIGNHYKEHLHLGDTISIKYLNKEFTATVVGILEESSRTAIDEYNTLDNYFIIPAMDAMELNDESENSFALKVYLSSTNGYIHSNKSFLEVEEKLDEICKAYGVEEYFLAGIYFKLFDWGIAKSIRFVLIASIALLIMFAILLSYLSYRKSRSIVIENLRVFIFAKYIESLIMGALTGLICFPLTLFTARFLGIQWWILAVVLGFVFLILPVITIFTKIQLSRANTSIESDLL